MADLMNPGGGLTNSKLLLADASEYDVVSPKKFYSLGSKELKTGNLVDRGVETATSIEVYDGNLYLRIPFGAYRTSSGPDGGTEVRTPRSGVYNLMNSTATASRVADGSVKGDWASSSVSFSSVANGIYFVCLSSHSSSAGTITLPSGCSWLWHETATGSRDGDTTRSYGMNIGIFRTSTSGNKTINYNVGYDHAAGTIKIARIS